MDLASQSPRKVLWSRAEADKALEMYNKGASYSTLGVHFQKTRGSIAGLINRFRTKGLAVRNFEKVLVTKAVKPKKADPIALAIINQQSKGVSKRIRLRMIESDTEVTFAELQHFHCRFPLGDPKLSDFRFCGKFKCDGAPYCKDHCAVAYTGLPQRRR